MFHVIVEGGLAKLIDLSKVVDDLSDDLINDCDCIALHSTHSVDHHGIIDSLLTDALKFALNRQSIILLVAKCTFKSCHFLLPSFKLLFVAFQLILERLH